MMEDCASSMSAKHGCTDDKAVVGNFKEALKQRLGEEIFNAWFVNGLTFQFVNEQNTAVPNQVGTNALKLTGGRIIVSVRGQFALERLRRNFIREMRGAAMQACGQGIEVELQLAAQPTQPELPLGQLQPQDSDAVSGTADENQTSNKRKAKRKQSENIRRKKPAKKSAKPLAAFSQLTLPNMPAAATSVPHEKDTAASEPSTAALSAANTDTPQRKAPAASLSNFIDGPCNHFALTAVKMVCETPNGGSPLFLCGPPGVGKTHLLTAIADYLRRGRRMRRVVHITAEKFTNDFIASVSSGNLTAFRARHRDLDALLIDDAQFLSAKKATLREMQYTIDGLADRGKTLVFSGSHAPTEISGLTPELAGRMSAGFVCPMQSIDLTTRVSLLRQRIDESDQAVWPDEIVTEIASLMVGDGRRIQSIVNLVDLLQRMYGRMPTMNEIRQHAGDQLRNGQITTLATIENAVMKLFQLDDGTLKSRSQARTATEPRMLAMYLSRELTPAAFSEIGRHYGGRSHSAAILAVSRVEQWLRTGKPLGRGQASFSARDALNRIESMLRSG